MRRVIHRRNLLRFDPWAAVARLHWDGIWLPQLLATSSRWSCCFRARLHCGVAQSPKTQAWVESTLFAVPPTWMAWARFLDWGGDVSESLISYPGWVLTVPSRCTSLMAPSCSRARVGRRISCFGAPAVALVGLVGERVQASDPSSTSRPHRSQARKRSPIGRIRPPHSLQIAISPQQRRTGPEPG
jgi:hypothetical protein